jgi:hypothetical protein
MPSKNQRRKAAYPLKPCPFLLKFNPIRVFACHSFTPKSISGLSSGSMLKHTVLLVAQMAF